MTDSMPPASPEPTLKRSLSLAMLTLYGLGTTIGAGIFVLVGKIAGISGVYAPFAFLLASVLAGLSAFSFAEMSSRYPESAGEAAYVREGLRMSRLSMVVGLLVVVAGTISSSAIVNGFVGYLSELVAMDASVAVILTVGGLGIIAAVGIAPSVTVAALVTVFEIGALAVVIAAATWRGGPGVVVPEAPFVPLSGDDWLLAVSGAVLAFYAFIGFEDIVNVAEEAHEAERTIPRAIVLTLVFTLILYVAVAAACAAIVPAPDLADSAAPLVLVFERASGLPGQVLAGIAVVSVLNGALIQTIMASRVLYGMGRRRMLPAILGRVNRRTRTPLISTALVTVAIMVLALFLPIVSLARATSFVTLGIFLLVNVSLIALRLRETIRPPGTMRVPLAVPVMGAAASVGLLGFQVWEALAD